MLQNIFLLPKPSKRLFQIAKKLAFIGAFTGLTIIACHGYYWYQGATIIQEKLSAWSNDININGGRVFLKDLSVSGYPMHFIVSSTAVKINSNFEIGNNLNLNTAWTGGAFQAQAPIWHPSNFTLQTSGRHSWTGIDESRNFWLTMNLGKIKVNIKIKDAEPNQLMIDLKETELTSNIFPRQIYAQSITLQAGLKKDGPKLIQNYFSGQVNGLQLPLSASFPLGRIVNNISFRAKPGLPSPSNKGSSASSSLIASWRNIVIENAVLRWNTFDANAYGTLSIDKNYYPKPFLTVSVIGHRTLINSLVKGGLISPVQGAATKLALSIFSEPSKTGRIKIPVQEKDGWLTTGQLRLLKLKSLKSLLYSGAS